MKIHADNKINVNKTIDLEKVQNIRANGETVGDHHFFPFSFLTLSQTTNFKIPPNWKSLQTI